MAESTVLEDIDTREKQSHVRYFKAVVVEDFKADGINQIEKRILDKIVLF